MTHDNATPAQKRFAAIQCSKDLQALQEQGRRSQCKGCHLDLYCPLTTDENPPIKNPRSEIVMIDIFQSEGTGSRTKITFKRRHYTAPNHPKSYEVKCRTYTVSFHSIGREWLETWLNEPDLRTKQGSVDVSILPRYLSVQIYPARKPGRQR